MNKIKDLILFAKNELKKTNFGLIEIQCLLAKAFKKNKIYILINLDEFVPLKIENIFINYIKKLKQNIPFNYILKKKEWMGFSFYLSKSTLIPREDTRILLEAILSLKKNIKKNLLAEIGTGCGILPVLINKMWPEAKLYTVEINKKTAKIANKNFKKYKTKVKILIGNFLEPLILNKIKVNILFSNPPYISEKEYKNLDLFVKNEPKEALIGGEDGLLFYRRFALEYKEVLENKGYLVFEIGTNQVINIIKIFKNTDLKIIKIIKDDAKRDRVIILKREKNENKIF